MQINTTTQFGNFALNISGEFTDEQVAALAAEGLAKLAISENGGKAEKALAGYDKRPQGFKRDSIPFNEANADTLSAHVRSVTFDKTVVPLSVDVTEYVNSADRLAAQGIISRKNGVASALEALAEKVGFDYAEVSELTKDNEDFVLAIVRYTREI